MSMITPIWGRFGITLDATPDEVKALLNDTDNSGSVLAQIIADGRARLDGESYIPQPCVDEYNRNYGMAYESFDRELETSYLQDVAIRSDIPKERPVKDRGDAR